MISDSKLQKKIGFTPFKAQEEIIANREREIVIAAGRRFGKSAITAYIALKTLLEPNKKIWIVAPTYDLTGKVFEYVVKWFAKCVPDGIGGVSYRPYPKIRTALGSTLEGRSTENPTGLLGEEVDLEIIDEASRIERKIYDTYLYPVTSSRQGNIVMISTPFGKNWFYEKWIQAKDRGSAFQYESRANPFFREEEWEHAKEKLPEQVFKQEYMASFLEDAAGVFRGILEVVVKNCFEDARGDRSYVMGVDLAKINDFTVLTVIDRFSHKVVAWERFKDINYPLQKARIEALAKRYRARIFLDSTGLGDPIGEDLRRAGFLVEDYKMSNKSKQQLIEKLSLFIEQKGIIIPDEKVLIDELSSYSYQLSEHGNWKYSAPIGYHDDCVTSLALATWGLDSPKKNDNSFLRGKPKKVVRYQYL